MKIFLIKIVIFFAGVLFIDIAFGQVFDALKVKARGGATLRDNFICTEMKSNVLTVGSSCCEHHYNSSIMEDSLGKSTYNAGQSGNGIIVAYARYKMVCERHKPELLIYDITPDFDLLEGFDNHRYLTWLKSYYQKDFVKEIFETIDSTEKYKMMSRMYAYNSRFIEILIDYLHPILDKGVKGYVPLEGELDSMKIRQEHQTIITQYKFDKVKMGYITRLIDAVGSDSIIFVASPRWYGMDKRSFEPLVNLCKNRGVRFLDFANNPKYVHNDYYFKDGVHLNSRGADEFTKDLIKVIKPN